MNRHRTSRYALGAVVSSLLLLFGYHGVGQRAVRDSDLKATLLFNLSQFAHWPPESLGPTNAPFVIGNDPFGKFIDDLVANERAEGHRIEVHRFTKASEAANAQMLFISRTELRHASAILAALDNKPILTVCELSERTIGTQGCVVALVNQDKSVRIRINLDAARRTGIVISSKVLHFADITKSD